MEGRIRFLLALVLMLALIGPPAVVGATEESSPPVGSFTLNAPDDPPQPEAVDSAQFFRITAEVDPARIPPGGRADLLVHFAIAEDHKVYADATRMVPEETAGIVFGPMVAPSSVGKREPDGKMARFFVDSALFRFPFTVADAKEVGEVTIPVEVVFRGCSETACFFPESRRLRASFVVDPAVAAAESRGAPEGATPTEVSDNPYQKLANRFGFIGVLVGAFLWGVFTSLTPCVYPMIPVTMSVVGAGAAGRPGRGFRLALTYVLGMSLTYAVFGVLAAWTGGLFGAYTDHPAVRLVIAGILVILALAMFDVFYLQMPAWISNRIQGVKGVGAVGVFLTGAASGAVVGPCVGPMLVGLLIYIAAIGSKAQGFLIMWAFALGVGMLFLVVGTFSGVAASLPKSGNWMVRIKYLFGVLMLALALYYIRPVVTESVFRLLLGGFLIGIGVFSGALDRVETASGGQRRLRKAFGILCLALGIAYCARFALDDGLRGMVIRDTQNGSEISWLRDEKSALALARQTNRPVLIDFYADWCAACVDLDRKTFSAPAVARAFENFVALRIDNSDPEAPSAKRLREKYGVIGLPTLIFLAPDGRVLSDATLTEFIGPDAFLQHLHKINE